MGFSFSAENAKLLSTCAPAIFTESQQGPGQAVASLALHTLMCFVHVLLQLT